MDNGRIVGQGSHAELMATNETYREIRILRGGQGPDIEPLSLGKRTNTVRNRHISRSEKKREFTYVISRLVRYLAADRVRMTIMILSGLIGVTSLWPDQDYGAGHRYSLTGILGVMLKNTMHIPEGTSINTVIDMLKQNGQDKIASMPRAITLQWVRALIGLLSPRLCSYHWYLRYCNDFACRAILYDGSHDQ